MRALTQQEFLESPAGIQAKRDLQDMVSSAVYITDARHDPYANRTAKFVERHINYLVKHPQIKPAAYLSNLRIMLRTGR